MQFLKHILSSSHRPVIIEVPHFASMRGREREITILRSDNGETWKEHSLDASEEAVQEVLNESFDGEGKKDKLFQIRYSHHLRDILFFLKLERLSIFRFVSQFLGQF